MLSNFLTKTFGGLSRQYYIRQFLFSLIFTIFLCATAYESRNTNFFIVLLASSILSLLYPYSRFVYESIVGYIMGDNNFLVDLRLMFIVKIMTMSFCYIFSIFIAPLGLAYLYFYHSKQEKEASQEETKLESHE